MVSPHKTGGHLPQGRPTQGLAGTVPRNGTLRQVSLQLLLYLKPDGFVSEVVPYAATSDSFWSVSVVCGALLHVGATWVLPCWLLGHLGCSAWVVSPGLPGICGQFDFVCVPVVLKHSAGYSSVFVNSLVVDRDLAYAHAVFQHCRGYVFLLPYILRQSPYR